MINTIIKNFAIGSESNKEGRTKVKEKRIECIKEKSNDNQKIQQGAKWKIFLDGFTFRMRWTQFTCKEKILFVND